MVQYPGILNQLDRSYSKLPVDTMVSEISDPPPIICKCLIISPANINPTNAQSI